MDGPTPECLLLSLPAELRRRVYEAYFQDARIDALRCRGTIAGIDVPAITRANRQLHRETLPLYYGCATFCLNHPGHRDYSADDETFYRWLQCSTVDGLQRMRHLELRVRIPYVPHRQADAMKDPSMAIINVDLSVAEPGMAIVNLGYYSDCPLMIQPIIKKAVARIPRVEKKPLVTREVLWNIWEACYFLSRSDPRERRTWADFVRAYALNQSKAKPQRWSEDVYYVMSQEAIYGANWHLRDVPSADICKRTWDCR